MEFTEGGIALAREDLPIRAERFKKESK